MREFWLRLALVLLLVVMWIFHCAVWSPARAAATFLSQKLEALELALLMAGAKRRTRNESDLT